MDMIMIEIQIQIQIEERRIQIGVCIYDNGIQQLLVSDIKLRLEKFGENLDLYY